MDAFDPKSLTLPGSSLRLTSVPRRSSKPPRHKSGERFLKGPVPLNWLLVAASLSGKCLHVGLALWFRSGVERKRTVSLPTVLTEQFGVDRYAKTRALNLLEQAGLIWVVRQRGKNPLVTLLDVEGAADESHP